MHCLFSTPFYLPLSRTGTVPKKQMSEKEMRADSQGIIQYIHTYIKKKKKRLGGGKNTKTKWDANFIPAEKLTTGKKRPSMLKFSNIP